MTDIITKEDLIKKLKEICEMGWMPSARQGNDGGVGNTLEDLLGIQENNLPIPNAAEWELKCQRTNTSSLTTLFHLEPSPQALKFVPNVLLPKYGWKHDKAGVKYPSTERSFRQTINGLSRTDRGFGIIVNRESKKIEVSFDANAVDTSRHAAWIKDVEAKAGLGDLTPRPYWGFEDLFHKAGTKLHNCFYVQADCERKRGIEYLCYCKVMILQKVSIEKLIAGIERGNYFIINPKWDGPDSLNIEIRLEEIYNALNLSIYHLESLRELLVYRRYGTVYGVIRLNSDIDKIKRQRDKLKTFIEAQISIGTKPPNHSLPESQEDN